VIGGLAVQIWGEARLTIDADLTISSSVDYATAPMVELITRHFRSRITDPFEFACKTRMILITASNGVDVDISLGLPGYEDDLITHSVIYELEPGKSIRLCSAEDLIIHKAIAGRQQDVRDIQGIIYRQGEKLDLLYIRSWLAQFSELLEEPAVQGRFEKAWENFI
jgi:hypothetical protein